MTDKERGEDTRIDIFDLPGTTERYTRYYERLGLYGRLKVTSGVVFIAICLFVLWLEITSH
ncbi:hypothetical protein [Mesorhizobium sp.]|uniref:hypothetical protein n=1 Tax=Mesorhizobium sp. TaxID=1871066 RepID=UPI000FE8BFA7|nr:hypothetical protein [Mesorhizobium sp.]RWK60323.1 MAG: hypothetical protein EOR49_22060 [Mesorhizobium sp.]RWM48460.1 MAG: hypothetical protein EOR76_12250 [Mesorhizobium sp.]RWM54928.1 MAG: hypothetical protein EOR78_16925 [Mesorhizobium sp.]RWM57329.1 MAG: hypothetical protein EOR79_16760 [Mesorhizobium sp.]RWN01376.1 MAG: hypothetical protein EOR85_15310 [Mesorhizobium sp.]